MEHVAKVKSASIEVEGVTVIAGLNGTGKSTVSKCLFSVINGRKDLQEKILADKEEEIRKIIKNWMDSDGLDKESYDFLPLMPAVSIAHKIIEGYTIGMDDLSQIRRVFEDWSRAHHITIKEYDNIISKIQKKIAKGSKKEYVTYVAYFMETYFGDVFKKQVNSFGKSEEAHIHLILDDKNSEKMECDLKFKDNQVTSYEGSIREQEYSAVYVDTKSVLDVYKEYIRQDILFWDEAGGRTSVQNMELFYAISEEKKLTFSESQEAKKSIQITKQIIQNVTHGKLIMDGNDIQFNDQEAGNKIEFENLSSGLKIFVLIQSLLENYALKGGDVLLVDEPEVNLHPEWQVLLADIFVQMYKELNIRMVINSHSPYFIRAIEVKMAEHECAGSGRYYYMKNEDGMSVCQDVTEETNVIYETLYKPLESL